MSDGTVVVVGSMNVDLVLRVDRLPARGETVAGADLERTPGGKGLNQAVAAARAGARVALVGAVGQDEPGRWLRGFVADEGIVVGHVVAVARPTGTAVVLVDEAGANAIVVSPGANDAVPPVLVATVGLSCSAADVVVCQGEVPTEVVDAAIGSARAAGATTVLNQAPFRPLTPAQWSGVDVLVVNETELAALVDEEVRSASAGSIAAPEGDQGLEQLEGLDRAAARSAAATSAAALLDRRGHAGLAIPAVVVVTLGAGGAVVVAADGERREVPAPVVDAIDTVGAGDCVVGWLAAGLMGLPVAPRASDEAPGEGATSTGVASAEAVTSALRRAVAAAALSVQRPGAAASMPFAAELV